MLAHGHNLGDNGIVGPLDTENFGQFLQVLRRSFSDRKNSVTEPAHAQAAELLVKELDAKLRREKGNVFDNGQTHTPLLVFGELDNGGEKGLRKKFDADNYLVSVRNRRKRHQQTHHC